MKFDSSLPYKSSEKYTPAGNPIQNVGAILLLSAGVVVIVLLLGLLICVSMEWPLRFIPCGAGVALLALWVMLLAMYREWPKLFFTLEQTIERDINQDGHIGPPPQRTTIELPAGPNRLRIADFAIEPELLMEWCRAAVNRESLAINAWIARFSLPDGTQGRQRYEAFRAKLIYHGIAEDAGGNVGLRVRWNDDAAFNFVSRLANMAAEDGRPLIGGE